MLSFLKIGTIPAIFNVLRNAPVRNDLFIKWDKGSDTMRYFLIYIIRYGFSTWSLESVNNGKHFITISWKANERIANIGHV